MFCQVYNNVLRTILQISANFSKLTNLKRSDTDTDTVTRSDTDFMVLWSAAILLPKFDRVSAGAVQLSHSQSSNPPQFVSPWLGAKGPSQAKPNKNAKNWAWLSLAKPHKTMFNWKAILRNFILQARYWRQMLPHVEIWHFALANPNKCDYSFQLSLPSNQCLTERHWLIGIRLPMESNFQFHILNTKIIYDFNSWILKCWLHIENLTLNNCITGKFQQK